MIIWGHKGYNKVLGNTQSSIECQHCHNSAPFQIVETGFKFTLYFIPLFPYGRHYYVSCPICSYGREIERNKIEEAQHW